MQVPSPLDNPTTSSLLAASAEMQSLLADCTGLTEFDRKLVTYYTLATHALPSLDKFPLLCIQGKSHTGKSTTMEIIGLFCRSIQVNFRGTTPAALREQFANAYQITIIAEEGDKDSLDASKCEQLLSDRFSRQSSDLGLQQTSGDGRWIRRVVKTFGATVIHRRKPFQDIALANRAITVVTRTVPGKSFLRPPDKANTDLTGLTLQLPVVAAPAGVAGRVFSNYSPILGLLELVPDCDFGEQILERMRKDTEDLIGDQMMEADSMVAAALVQIISFDKQESPWPRYIRLSDIARKIEEEHLARELSPRQVGKICREQLNLDVRTSHGQSKVIIKSEAQLEAACNQAGYEDEAVKPREIYISLGSSTSSTLSTQGVSWALPGTSETNGITQVN